MASPTPEANARAKTLFESMLTPTELEEHRKLGYITLTGSEGGVYQLVTTHSCCDNIIRIDPETQHKTEVLCVAPNLWPFGSGYRQTHLPLADGWVGQLLGLRSNEMQLRRVAVISYYGGGGFY
jgi:hypothetical protein